MVWQKQSQTHELIKVVPKQYLASLSSLSHRSDISFLSQIDTWTVSPSHFLPVYFGGGTKMLAANEPPEPEQCLVYSPGAASRQHMLCSIWDIPDWGKVLTHLFSASKFTFWMTMMESAVGIKWPFFCVHLHLCTPHSVLWLVDSLPQAWPRPQGD